MYIESIDEEKINNFRMREIGACLYVDVDDAGEDRKLAVYSVRTAPIKFQRVEDRLLSR